METKFEALKQQAYRDAGHNTALLYAVVALIAASPDREIVLRELPKIAQTLESTRGQQPNSQEYLGGLQSALERIAYLVQQLGPLPWSWSEKTP